MDLDFRQFLKFVR